MTSSRVPLAVALSGATILALSPVTAQAASPIGSFTTQDDAEVTSEPEDDAQQTSEPTDEAEQTSDPADSESTDETGSDGAEEEGEPQTSEGLDVGDELVGPVDDPGFWEGELDSLGFVNASCSAQQPDAADPGVFTVTGAAPEGTDWILAILLADIDDDGGVFDFFFEPLVGESFGLQDEDGSLRELSEVILCSADLEASPDITVDDVADSVDVNADDRVNGPVVETDVPPPASDLSLGGLALLGVGAAAAGAVATRAGKGAGRR